jgi:hypothetical protein
MSPQSTPSQQTPTTSPQTEPAAGQNPANAAGAAQAAPAVDAEAAHRELLAARDALTQLTQLPAAAQLQGETRTQVQQLIASFNELITATTDWRSSYDKVDTSLTALIGPDTAAAPAAADAASTTTTPAPTTATPTPTTGATTGSTGAVGTSGSATAQLDPAIRAKLVELRSHLKQFEKASGGAK